MVAAIGVSVAGAAAHAAAPHGVSALAFDAGTNALLKLESGALYRRSGAEWKKVPLAESARRAPVTALAASRQPPHMIYAAVRGSGVVRSADGGLSWDLANGGLPPGDVEVLAAHATLPETVYAYVRGKGIYRSEDRGGHWRLMGVGPRQGAVQLVHSDMPGSMQSGWLFAATTRGAARSMDCFCGWHDAGALARPLSAIAYDPRQPARIYAAGAGGLFVSENGGELWSPLPFPGRVTAMAATAEALFAADDGARVSISRDHGATWERMDG